MFSNLGSGAEEKPSLKIIICNIVNTYLLLVTLYTFVTI